MWKGRSKATHSPFLFLPCPRMIIPKMEHVGNYLNYTSTQVSTEHICTHLSNLHWRPQPENERLKIVKTPAVGCIYILVQFESPVQNVQQ